MAQLKSKGTALAVKIATVFTTIAQVISMDKDDMASETYEADTLDNANAGIPYAPTGRTEGGNFSAELFLDPALTVHKYLLGLLAAPAKSDYQLSFADAGPTQWTFSGAGIALAGPKVALKEGVKASVKIKLDGLPTFPA